MLRHGDQFPLLGESLRSRTNIVLPNFVLLRLFATVQRSPFRLCLEQTHGLDVLSRE